MRPVLGGVDTATLMVDALRPAPAGAARYTATVSGAAGRDSRPWASHHKVAIGRLFGEREALKRFEREARTLANLDHPNVVTVYDYGELSGGGAYLVMERLRGVTLRAELKGTGRLSPPFRGRLVWADPIGGGGRA